MTLVDRPQLLDRFRPYYEDGLIKVVTGLRRSGKSSLMHLLAKDIENRLDRPSEDFLFLNFEDFGLRNLTHPEALHDFLLDRISKARKRLTVFLDEIQNVESWETVVNSIRFRDCCDIYVTGSNSQLLSGELATHLAGRAIQVEVYPFSYAEFRVARKRLFEDNITDAQIWQEYLTWGGMPGIVRYPDLSVAATYLRDVYRSILLKDITDRHNIRQTALLEMTYAYLLEQVGHRISPDSIEKFLKSERLRLSRDTLLDYLRAGREAFMHLRVDGVDCIGKNILRLRPKIYCADHGFREAFFSGSNNRNIEQVLENIVATELTRRGWSLRFGSVSDKKVDFVADKNGRRMYVQVCYLLASDQTLAREFSPLQAIRDNWPKLILSLDEVNRSTLGIEHRNLQQWLLQPDV